jgi:acetylornithine deacetylase/succinyl-diaminopimelate desuccinylase-like protein
MTSTTGETVRSYVEDHSKRFFADLIEWLTIPSISADPDKDGDVRRSADWLADALRDTGFPIVELWEIDGGEPDAPTVLVYGHHDVQPIDPIDEWRTPPFTPTVDNGLLHGRGASDDKGQVWFHTLGVRAHLAATGRENPAINLKLLIEGEEESGSPNFGRLIRARADRLGCDVIVNSDTSMWSKDVPTTCTGMRGMVPCEVTFRGPSSDVHSGSFGGTVPNPITELCRVLAQLHDERGRVTIPGFYDKVIGLTPIERDLFARLPFNEQDWLSTARSRSISGEDGYTTLERVWARPTAELNGIRGGHIGEGMKTIIPAEASAKVSFRLVAAQEPAEVREAFRGWLTERVRPGIEVDVRFFGDGVRPCLTPLDHPALKAVTRSLERAFGQEALYTREGGSGPTTELQDVLGAPVLFLATCVPDDGYHGPNEKAEMSLLLKGAEAAAYLWAELADVLRKGATHGVGSR